MYGRAVRVTSCLRFLANGLPAQLLRASLAIGACGGDWCCCRRCGGCPGNVEDGGKERQRREQRKGALEEVACAENSGGGEQEGVNGCPMRS